MSRNEAPTFSLNDSSDSSSITSDDDSQDTNENNTPMKPRISSQHKKLQHFHSERNVLYDAQVQNPTTTSSSLPKSALTHKSLRKTIASQHTRSNSMNMLHEERSETHGTGVASSPPEGTSYRSTATTPSRRKRKTMGPVTTITTGAHTRTSSGLTNTSSNSGTALSSSEMSTSHPNQLHHNFITPGTPHAPTGHTPPSSPSALSITSPQNLIKLKSYIKTLRSQYAMLSHHFSLQQEDMMLMRKEMSFMEDLLEKRMNRIRQLELEKRIDTDEFWKGNPSESVTTDDDSHTHHTLDSHGAPSPINADYNKNINERLKELDNVLNQLYVEKRERKITFVEEDDHISREELISKLKLENQKLKQENQRLEKENIEWAKQITLKQEKLDQLKAAAKNGGDLNSDSLLSRRKQQLVGVAGKPRPKTMEIRTSDLASIFGGDGAAKADSSGETLSPLSVTNGSTPRNGDSHKLNPPPKFTKKVSFSEKVSASTPNSEDTLPMSDDTDLSQDEEEGKGYIPEGKSFGIIKIDDNIEGESSNEVITFSDSDEDEED